MNYNIILIKFFFLFIILFFLDGKKHHLFIFILDFYFNIKYNFYLHKFFSWIMSGNITITPFSATLKRDTDFFDKMDPYVVVKLGS